MNVQAMSLRQGPTATRPHRMTSAAHFPLIDLLRGFAAISVLTLHVIALSNWTAFPRGVPSLGFGSVLWVWTSFSSLAAS